MRKNRFRNPLQTPKRRSLIAGFEPLEDRRLMAVVDTHLPELDGTLTPGAGRVTVTGSEILTGTSALYHVDLIPGSTQTKFIEIKLDDSVVLGTSVTSTATQFDVNVSGLQEGTNELGFFLTNTTRDPDETRKVASGRVFVDLTDPTTSAPADGLQNRAVTIDFEDFYDILDRRNSGLSAIKIVDSNGPGLDESFLDAPSAESRDYSFGGIQGAHTLTITATDFAGRTASITRTYTYDTQAPTVGGPPALDAEDDTGPTQLGEGEDILAFHADGTTSQQNDLTFRGITENATSVVVTITGTTKAGVPFSAQANAVLSGNNYTATFDATILPGGVPEGTYDVVATASDGVNTTTTSSYPLVVDLTPPDAVSISLQTDTSGPHVSGADGITNNRNPAFSIGAAEQDARITLRRDGVVVGFEDPVGGQAATSVRDDSGTPASPSQFTFQYDAFQIDLAGNVGPLTAPTAYAIDPTAPVVAALQATSRESGVLTTIITRESRPEFEFTLREQRFDRTNEILVQLIERVGNSDRLLATLRPDIAAGVDNSSFDQTLTIRPDADKTLSPGSRTIVVAVNDAAGNTQTRQQLNIVVLPPGQPTEGAAGIPVFTEAFDIRNFSTVVHLTSNAPAGATSIFVDRAVPVGTQIVLDENTPSREARTVFGVIPGATPLDPVELVLKTATAGNTLSFAHTSGAAAREVLFPWQMAFDNTTQTIWFSMELGTKVGQFDPATGLVRMIDLRPLGESARNPHGMAFDLETHNTPRVWMVHRNIDPASNLNGAFGRDARLSYVDLTTNEIVSYDFFADPALSNFDVRDFHAVFVDPTGDVWVTSDHGDKLLQFDFDQGSSINRRTPKVIVRTIPHDLHNGTAPDNHAHSFHPHGAEVIIDDQTGEQYVWLISEHGTGRVALLRPEAGDDDGDLWTTWDVDDAVNEKLGGTFLKVDDNETPGNPQDDRVIATFPVTGDGASPSARGVAYMLEPGSILRDPNDATSQPATITTWRIPRIATAAAPPNGAAINQPYVDRGGSIYFIDRLGSVGRIDSEALAPEIPKYVADAIQFTTPASSVVTLAVTEPSIVMAVTSSNSVRMAADRPTSNATYVSNDQSFSKGLDQYQVAGVGSGFVTGNQGNGAFRGFLNAGDVLYTSITQSDQLSSTVFAETARRQMAIVRSPNPLPPGSVLQGRLGFQVLRDGSLILSGRGDGQVVDQQVNLSHLLQAKYGGAAEDFAIRGDVSAIALPNGTVEIVGRGEDDGITGGGLIVYRFRPRAGEGNVNRPVWRTADFSNPNRWTVARTLPPSAAGAVPAIILAGDPTAFIDAGGVVRAAVTTNEGHLLVYDTANGSGFVDLSSATTMKVYASPGVVVQGGTTYLYATDQAGGLVEFSYTGGIPAAGVAVLVPNNPQPSNTLRDTMVFQDVTAIAEGATRHVFAVDGRSRLVHIEINGSVANAVAENVTQEIQDTGTADGYFAFQQSHVARVYSGVSAGIGADGKIFVYGTNGRDLIEFTRLGSGANASWRAGNLTNDIFSTDDADQGTRVPANKVFGAPGAYVTPDGERRIMLINADGDVIEYFYQPKGTGGPRFHTQNITLGLAPVASADRYRTLPGATLVVNATGGVLANDAFFGTQPLQATLITQPEHGQVQLNQDGSFSYQPDVGFVGTDSFTYEASNGVSESRRAEVTIVVEPIKVGKVVDDGDRGYSQSGTWKTKKRAAGSQGDYRESGRGVGRDVATWKTSGLAKNGFYEVFTRWAPKANGATNAHYTIFDDTLVVGGTTVNQQQSPSGEVAGGVMWQSLGVFNFESGKLKVTLSDRADGKVMANAIRVVRRTDIIPSPALSPSYVFDVAMLQLALAAESSPAHGSGHSQENHDAPPLPLASGGSSAAPYVPVSPIPVPREPIQAEQIDAALASLVESLNPDDSADEDVVDHLDPNDMP